MRNIRKNILVLLFGIIFVTFTSFNTNAEWYDEPNSSDNSMVSKLVSLFLQDTIFLVRRQKDWVQLLKRYFLRLARPDAYIIGEEASGAIIAGLTYGEGTITTKNLGKRKYIGKDQALEWIMVAMGLELCFLSTTWII